VRSARQNADLNTCGARLSAYACLPAGGGPQAAEWDEGAGYDVVVANILQGPLVTLAPQLGRLLRPGGALGLSGILASQARRAGGRRDLLLPAQTSCLARLGGRRSAARTGALPYPPRIASGRQPPPPPLPPGRFRM
jgi:hypothetical protein